MLLLFCCVRYIKKGKDEVSLVFRLSMLILRFPSFIQKSCGKESKLIKVPKNLIFLFKTRRYSKRMLGMQTKKLAVLIILPFFHNYFIKLFYPCHKLRVG